MNGSDYRHCTNERCRWFLAGIAHVGPCYDGRSPAEVAADEALAESRGRRTYADRVVEAIENTDVRFYFPDYKER